MQHYSERFHYRHIPLTSQTYDRLDRVREALDIGGLTTQAWLTEALHKLA